MEAVDRIDQIKDILREGKELNVSPEELLDSILQLIPEKIIHVQEPYKTSPEKLQYLKEYRLEQKRLQKIRDKEMKKQQKIDKALERTTFFCYNCKKNVKISNPETNTSEIVRKSHLRNPKILIINKCPICSNIVRGFGGYLNIK